MTIVERIERLVELARRGPRSRGRAAAEAEAAAAAVRARLRQPYREAPIEYTPGVVDQILSGLAAHGFAVREHAVDVAAYRAFRAAAGYEQRHPRYYPGNRAEKALEHFVAADLLALRPDDVYVDVASEKSPAPDIYHALFGCRTYRQDLAYRDGLHGDRIGGSAAAMPVPDGFASAMGLHCSFEHFEADVDSRFVAEAGRVLREGGRLAIVPLYLYAHHAVLTDPAVSGREDVPFDEDAIVHLSPGWGNRHGRFYDPAHLARRVRDHLGPLSMEVFHVPNAVEADPSCYLRFAALIAKRSPGA